MWFLSPWAYFENFKDINSVIISQGILLRRKYDWRKGSLTCDIFLDWQASFVRNGRVGQRDHLYLLLWALIPLWSCQGCGGMHIVVLFSPSAMSSSLATPWTSSPPGFSDHGILQARTLEWVAISFSGESSQPRNRSHISCIGRQIHYHWATWEAQWDA